MYIYYTYYRWVGHDILLKHTKSPSYKAWEQLNSLSLGMIMMILPETQWVKSPFFSG